MSENRTPQSQDAPFREDELPQDTPKWGFGNAVDQPQPLRRGTPGELARLGGVSDLGMTVGAGLQALGQATGWEGAERAGERRMLNNAVRSQANPPEYDSLDDIQNVGDAFGFARETLMRELPGLAVDAAGAVAGGLIARTPTAAGAVRSARLAATAEAKRRAREQLAKRIGTGASMGAAVTSYPQLVGEAQMQFQEAAGEDVDTGAEALLAGAGMSLVDFATNKILADSLGKAFIPDVDPNVAGSFLREGARQLLTQVPKNTAANALGEGAQDVLVNALTRAWYDPEYDLYNDDTVMAMLAGGTVGGTLGAGAAGVNTVASLFKSGEGVSDTPAPSDSESPGGEGSETPAPTETARPEVTQPEATRFRQAATESALPALNNQIRDALARGDEQTAAKLRRAKTQLQRAAQSEDPDAVRSLLEDPESLAGGALRAALEGEPQAAESRAAESQAAEQQPPEVSQTVADILDSLDQRPNAEQTAEPQATADQTPPLGQEPSADAQQSAAQMAEEDYLSARRDEELREESGVQKKPVEWTSAEQAPMQAAPAQETAPQDTPPGQLPLDLGLSPEQEGVGPMPATRDEASESPTEGQPAEPPPGQMNLGLVVPSEPNPDEGYEAYRLFGREKDGKPFANETAAKIAAQRRNRAAQEGEYYKPESEEGEWWVREYRIAPAERGGGAELRADQVPVPTAEREAPAPRAELAGQLADFYGPSPRDWPKKLAEVEADGAVDPAVLSRGLGETTYEQFRDSLLSTKGTTGLDLAAEPEPLADPRTLPLFGRKKGVPFKTRAAAKAAAAKRTRAAKATTTNARNDIDAPEYEAVEVAGQWYVQERRLTKSELIKALREEGRLAFVDALSAAKGINKERATVRKPSRLVSEMRSIMVTPAAVVEALESFRSLWAGGEELTQRSLIDRDSNARELAGIPNRTMLKTGPKGGEPAELSALRGIAAREGEAYLEAFYGGEDTSVEEAPPVERVEERGALGDVLLEALREALDAAERQKVPDIDALGDAEDDVAVDQAMSATGNMGYSVRIERREADRGAKEGDGNTKRDRQKTISAMNMRGVGALIAMFRMQPVPDAETAPKSMGEFPLSWQSPFARLNLEVGKVPGDKGKPYMALTAIDFEGLSPQFGSASATPGIVTAVVEAFGRGGALSQGALREKNLPRMLRFTHPRLLKKGGNGASRDLFLEPGAIARIGTAVLRAELGGDDVYSRPVMERFSTGWSYLMQQGFQMVPVLQVPQGRLLTKDKRQIPLQDLLVYSHEDILRAVSYMLDKRGAVATRGMQAFAESTRKLGGGQDIHVRLETAPALADYLQAEWYTGWRHVTPGDSFLSDAEQSAAEQILNAPEDYVGKITLLDLRVARDFLSLPLSVQKEYLGKGGSVRDTAHAARTILQAAARHLEASPAVRRALHPKAVVEREDLLNAADEVVRLGTEYAAAESGAREDNAGAVIMASGDALEGYEDNLQGTLAGEGLESTTGEDPTDSAADEAAHMTLELAGGVRPAPTGKRARPAPENGFTSLATNYNPPVDPGLWEEVDAPPANPNPIIIPRRKAGSGLAGMSAQQLAQQKDEILKSLGIHEDLFDLVHIHEDLGGVVEEAKRLGGFVAAGRGDYAVFDPLTGTVHLSARAHTDDESVRRSLRHEFFAHYGLRAVGPERYAEILSDVRKTRNMRWAKGTWDSVRQDYPDLSGDLLAEEVFARFAEDPPQSGFFERILEKIVKALQNYGLLKGRVTKQQIRTLLEETADAVAAGRRIPKGRERVMLARARAGREATPNLTRLRDRVAETWEDARGISTEITEPLMAGDTRLRSIADRYTKLGDGRSVRAAGMLRKLADSFERQSGQKNQSRRRTVRARQHELFGQLTATPETGLQDKVFKHYFHPKSKLMTFLTGAGLGKPRKADYLDEADAILASERPIPADASPEAAEVVRDVREWLDTAYSQLERAGLVIGQGRVANYYPFLLDRDAVLEDRTAVINRIAGEMRGDTVAAEKLLTRLLDEQTFDTDFDPKAPEASASFSRKLPENVREALRPYQLRSTSELMLQYADRMSKRAAYNAVFGRTVTVTRGDARVRLMHPYHELEETVKDLRKTHTPSDFATVTKYLHAQAGTYAVDTNPTIVRTLGALGVYQAWRVLGGVWFSSLPDVAFGMARSPSAAAYKDALVKFLGNKNYRKELNETAAILGLVRDDFTEVAVNDQLMHSNFPRWARRLNETLFRWNQMHRWTNSLRALGVGVFKESAERLLSETKRNDGLLEELGLSRDALRTWINAGKPLGGDAARTHHEVHGALDQFMEEFVLRPGVSSRPLIANHPYFAPFWFLKSFMWLIYEKVLRRAVGMLINNPDKAAALASMAVLMAGSTAFAWLGFWLRGAVLGRSEHFDPQGMDLFWESVQRGGLLGPFQLGVDAEEAGNRDNSVLMTLGGVTTGQIDGWAQDELSTSFVKALPIIPISPTLREQVHAALF